MSAAQSELPASAGGLLTNEECFMLLDIDIFNTDHDDLLKNFPSAAHKSDIGSYPYHQDEVSASLYPPSPADTKPSPAELANDLLQQLENQCKQENIFPNWLEEKVDLPIFDGICVARGAPLPPAAVPVNAYPSPPPPPPPTEELLREFETVYGVVELTHLTPPQSPPALAPHPQPHASASRLLISYAQQAHTPAPAPVPVALEPWHVPPPSAVLSADEYSCGYDAVDELVRHRAAQLPSPQPSDHSVRSSPPSSPRSSDEEWSGSGSGSGSSSGRAKPYSRGPDDRRSRKKEQNKNAATRYRQKKKAEIEVLLGEEATLRARHSELGDACSDLQREIRYLKGLMRDLFKAKGLIK